MTVIPVSAPEPLDTTAALQDGWVIATKAPRKSALSAPSIDSDSKKESEPWEKVKDGWDEHK